MSWWHRTGTENMGKVVALVDDLFFQMKLAETAKQLGLDVKVAANGDALMGLLQSASGQQRHPRGRVCVARANAARRAGTSCRLQRSLATVKLRAKPCRDPQRI